MIAQNPDLTHQSVPWIKEKGLHPEKAESFESLILSPIPKEGGLQPKRYGGGRARRRSGTSVRGRRGEVRR